jgi:hypothetical protein
MLSLAQVFVGWVERSETHPLQRMIAFGGFRFRSTHPTGCWLAAFADMTAQIVLG